MHFLLDCLFGYAVYEVKHKMSSNATDYSCLIYRTQLHRGGHLSALRLNRMIHCLDDMHSLELVQNTGKTSLMQRFLLLGLNPVLNYKLWKPQPTLVVFQPYTSEPSVHTCRFSTLYLGAICTHMSLFNLIPRSHLYTHVVLLPAKLLHIASCT